MLGNLIMQQDFGCGWIFSPYCPPDYFQVYVPLLFSVLVLSIGVFIFGTIVSIKDKLSRNQRMSLVWGGVGGSIVAGVIMKEGNFFPLIISCFVIAVTMYFGERARVKRQQRKTSH